MRNLFIAVLLMLTPLAVLGEISFEQLARLSNMPAQLQGSFRQEKYLASVDASLESSGQFSYQQAEAIRWQIMQPIQNEILMTAEGISSRQGDDELLRLDAETNPAVALMGEILFAVMTAQWESLADHFELSGEIEGQQWHAVLLPRQAVVRRLFDRVELQGAELLELVVLHESGGDKTTIFLDSALE